MRPEEVPADAAKPVDADARLCHVPPLVDWPPAASLTARKSPADAFGRFPWFSTELCVILRPRRVRARPAMDSDPVRRQGPERGSTGGGGRPRSFPSGPPNRPKSGAASPHHDDFGRIRYRRAFVSEHGQSPHSRRELRSARERRGRITWRRRLASTASAGLEGTSTGPISSGGRASRPSRSTSYAI